MMKMREQLLQYENNGAKWDASFPPWPKTFPTVPLVKIKSVWSPTEKMGNFATLQHSRARRLVRMLDAAPCHALYVHCTLFGRPRHDVANDGILGRTTLCFFNT